MLKTKSILKPIETTDWLRMSVMSKHTLNDWITPDNRITQRSYDVWMKVFSPPLKLVWDYYKRWLSFEEYKEKYLEYLRQEDINIEVIKLVKQARNKVITLLCIEDIADKCHRKILAEECLKYEPILEIIHE